MKYYLICEVSLDSQLVLSNFSHVLVEFYSVPSNFSVLSFRNYISSPLDFPRAGYYILFIPNAGIQGTLSTCNCNDRNMNYKALNVAKRPELWLQVFFRLPEWSWVCYLSFLSFSFIFVNQGMGVELHSAVWSFRILCGASAATGRKERMESWMREELKLASFMPCFHSEKITCFCFLLMAESVYKFFWKKEGFLKMFKQRRFFIYNKGLYLR